ncbi:MAG: Signal peptidase [Parcubacteria group bacterium]|nr:Signal peptidase [Parcubacteria group bacterium]
MNSLFGAASLVFVVLLVIVVICVLLIVSGWKIFQKAGRPGWASLIPFYRQAVLLELVNKPLWWILLFFVPIVNLFIIVITIRRLAHAFGKGVWFTVGLIFLPFIFYPILAFGTSTYVNAFPPAKPMSEAVKWTLIAAFVFIMIEGMMVLSLGAGRDTSRSDMNQRPFEMNQPV